MHCESLLYTAHCPFLQDPMKANYRANNGSSSVDDDVSDGHLALRDPWETHDSGSGSGASRSYDLGRSQLFWPGDQRSWHLLWSEEQLLWGARLWVLQNGCWWYHCHKCGRTDLSDQEIHSQKISRYLARYVLVASKLIMSNILPSCFLLNCYFPWSFSFVSQIWHWLIIESIG